MTSPTPHDRLDEHLMPAMLPPHIRLFHERDAEAVAEIFNDSEEGWPGGFMQGVRMTAERMLRRQREQAPQATFIAWEGDRAAGYCSFFEQPEERGSAGYIGLINVATGFQGRGYGRDLLRAALAYAGALGYRRVDLGTWEGNMKAVPLYKKTGFFWVPETSVHMENYLPLLLRIPALADFWADTNWYAAMVRDLSVREDLIEQGTMRVYPYEFRHGQRFVRATIDATARSITALETERWRIACSVDRRTLIAGRSGTVRWDVENRSGSPLPITLVAGAGQGLSLAKETTVLVDDRYVAEAPLHADLDYQPPRFGRRAPCVETLFVIDGASLRLETGVEVRRPFSAQLDPSRLCVLAGQRRAVTLRMHNAMDEPATAHLTIVPSPALIIQHEATGAGAAPLQLALPMEAEGYAGTTLHVTAAQPGAHELELRAEARIDGATVPMATLRLPLPAVAPGALVPFVAEQPDATDYLEREVRVESSTHRLVVDLRAGGWHLQDALSGNTLAGGAVAAGPPFRWISQARVTHTPAIEQRAGAVAITLRGSVPHLPDVAAEHEFVLTADGLLRIQTTIAAASSTVAAEAIPQAAVWLWRDQSMLPETALPTTGGLIVDDDVEWPDWSEPALQDPARFAEDWLAQQSGDRVVGLIWSEATRIEVGHWRSGVLQDAAALPPGKRRALPPIYVHTGPGDWRAVRARWRQLVCPDADPRDPVTRPIVQIAGPLLPAALLSGAQSLVLSSATNRALAGTLTFETPDGWHLAPATHHVQDLRIDAVRTIPVEARHHGTGPGAAPLHARLCTARADVRVLDGSLIDLGSGETVRVEEASLGGRRALRLDNGYLRFTLAPDYIGSIVALETAADGLNHLHSSFPEPREFGWLRPWYGGIYAALYGDQWSGFPGHARLFEESLRVEEAEQPGGDGRRWRGLTVHGMLTGKGLRGLELRASYLTLPGSNLLALRVAVRNHSGATLRAYPALVAYLQPDGTVAGTELLTDRGDRDRRLLRAQRTESVPAERWVAARNPATGRTLALVGAVRAAETRIVGEDWGTLGAHAGALAALRVPAGAERHLLAFLAVACEEAEARAYRALADTEELP